MRNSHFSLYEQALTNKTITVTYKPDPSVSNYSYKIYKEGALFDEVKVANGKSSTILLEESGDYSITVTLHLKDGTEKKRKVGIISWMLIPLIF